MELGDLKDPIIRVPYSGGTPVYCIALANLGPQGPPGPTGPAGPVGPGGQKEVYASTTDPGVPTADALWYDLTNQLLKYRDISGGVWALVNESNKVTKAGDTMLGPLMLFRDPQSLMESATKQYVDSKVVSAGISRTVTIISGATTAGEAPNTDYVYKCTVALTLTMPTAVGNKNRYTIKHVGASGTVTIATTASQTIDGATTFLINSQYMSIDLISDGTNWIVI